MKVELTDKFMRAIAPPETGRLEISDTKRPGLRLRVAPTGRCSWLYERRVKGGRKMKATLGVWPTVSLAEARKSALALEAEAMQGIDRVAQQRAEREAQEGVKRESMTTAQVLDLYGDLHLTGLKNMVERMERRRNLERAFTARLNGPVSALTTADCQRAIDEKVAAGKPVMANRLRAHIRHFTNWCARRGYIGGDIGATIDRPAKERARDVVLSVAQVHQILEAVSAQGMVWGGIIRLLVLTGQRSAEIREMRWSEVDMKARTLSKAGATTKNHKAHITHISAPAMDVLSAMRAARVGECDFVFSFDGDGPPSSMGKAKARLDAALGENFPKWTLHDLRTAMATALADSGFSEGVIDRILNHSATGSAPSAVARVYQRGDMLRERARALDAWAAMLFDRQAVSGANVMKLGATG